MLAAVCEDLTLHASLVALWWHNGNFPRKFGIQQPPATPCLFYSIHQAAVLHAAWDDVSVPSDGQSASCAERLTWHSRVNALPCAVQAAAVDCVFYKQLIKLCC